MTQKSLQLFPSLILWQIIDVFNQLHIFLADCLLFKLADSLQLGEGMTTIFPKTEVMPYNRY